MTEQLTPPPFATPLDGALWWVRSVPVVPLAPALESDGEGSKPHPQPLVLWRKDGPLRTEAEVRGFPWAERRAQLAIVLGPTADGRFLGAIDTDLKHYRAGMDEIPVGFKATIYDENVYTDDQTVAGNKTYVKTVNAYRHTTKTNGTHDLFFYKVAPPDSVPRRATGIGGFVDVLLDGLLVVPPTKFDRAGEYRVVHEGPIPEFEAPVLALDAAAPWLRQAWKEHRPKAVAAGRPGDAELVPEGRRHATLLSRAGKLRDLGVGANAILTDFRDFNARRCVPPLTDPELVSLADDVTRRYEPRHELPMEPPRPTYEAMLDQVGKIVRTKDEIHGHTILIWGAHSHLIIRFQSTFYLGFRGKTGSGKGTSVESCIALTPNGEVLGETTESYLASATDEGKAIGVEELDLMLERNPFIESLFRSGYRRGSYGGFKVPRQGGKGWEQARRSLFGPKAYDTHVGPSGHLLGRSILIDMEPDDSVNRALDAEWKPEVLAPVRSWLSVEAQRALSEWPTERFRSQWDSPEFRERVRKLGGRSGRDHVIGAIMLATCDMMRWKLDSEIATILAGRSAIEEEGVEMEVLDALRELAPLATADTELLYSEVLRTVNDSRKKSGIGRTLNRKTLAGPLKELGFRKGGDGSDQGDEWFKAKGGPNRDKVVLRPHRVLALFAPIPGKSVPSVPRSHSSDGADGTDARGHQSQLSADVNGTDGLDGSNSGSIGAEPRSEAQVRAATQAAFDQAEREEAERT